MIWICFLVWIAYENNMKNKNKMPNKSPTIRETYKETNQLTNPGHKIVFFANNLFLIKCGMGMENTETDNPCKNNNKRGNFVR